jgi:hypothetical protein
MALPDMKANLHFSEYFLEIVKLRVPSTAEAPGEPASRPRASMAWLVGPFHQPYHTLEHRLGDPTRISQTLKKAALRRIRCLAGEMRKKN